MKNLLIVGGEGALGSNVVHQFKNRSPLWRIMNIGYKMNKDADFNYLLKNNLKGEEIKIIHKEKESFIKDENFDCIINVAGGWTGGSLEDDNVINELDKMLNMNLYSTVLSIHMAKKFLNKNSLLVLTGAASVKENLNPGMIGYHISKQSVHHLTELVDKTGQLLEKSKIITILPTTIDTPSNRQAMSDADFSKWTNPSVIAKQIKDWADNKHYPNDNFYKF